MVFHYTDGRALYRRKEIEPVGSYLILSNSYQPHPCLQLEFALLVADCRSNPPYPDARVNLPHSSNIKLRHLSSLLHKNGSRQPTSVIPRQSAVNDSPLPGSVVRKLVQVFIVVMVVNILKTTEPLCIK